MKNIFATLLLLACLCAFAQQDASYSMYRFGAIHFNPAYAGSRDVLSSLVIYRHQWVKVPGAPRSANVSLHSPLRNDNLALGISYGFDQVGPAKTNAIEAQFAYRIPLGKKKKVRLCFGLSAGVTNYRSNLSSVQTWDANDPNFVDGNPSLWLPNVGFGIYAYSDRFFIGAALPRILSYSLEGNKVKLDFNSSNARQYYHVNAMAGYVFGIGKKVRFMPSFLFKYTPVGTPVQFDFNATFIFIDRVWLGAGYRLTDSYNFMAAVNITRQLRIGYSYDLTVSPLAGHTSGTHEVMLGFDFAFKKKNIVNPRYVSYF